jgi:hypothetical protein
MASVGCNTKVPRKDMSKHMTTENAQHMELLGKHAALEFSHFLEWTVLDIRAKLTGTDTSSLVSKPITTGLFKLYLTLQFTTATHISVYISISAAEGITQKLPEKLSVEGSQFAFIHPTDASRSFKTTLASPSLATIGTGFGFPQFMTRDRCSTEFVWPDGSLHVKATIKFPRTSQVYQV